MRYGDRNIIIAPINPYGFETCIAQRLLLTLQVLQKIGMHLTGAGFSLALVFGFFIKCRDKYPKKRTLLSD